MPRQHLSKHSESNTSGDVLPLPNSYLEPEDIARIFQVPLETVYQWRRKRTGPPGFRVGRHVRYHPDAVAQWVADQSREAA
ncbi:helix-turn-helix domain-containing protein [Kitasatospora sp. NPDC005751]|uniref:helix-turn-helix domain-containing protein n=1 Tax=Kitasatospora sp. NPDC005751 TaxID=3157064 RepID=UPI0033D6BA89